MPHPKQPWKHNANYKDRNLRLFCVKLPGLGLKAPQQILTNDSCHYTTALLLLTSLLCPGIHQHAGTTGCKPSASLPYLLEFWRGSCGKALHPEYNFCREPHLQSRLGKQAPIRPCSELRGEEERAPSKGWGSAGTALALSPKISSSLGGSWSSGRKSES